MGDNESPLPTGLPIRDTTATAEAAQERRRSGTSLADGVCSVWPSCPFRDNCPNGCRDRGPEDDEVTDPRGAATDDERAGMEWWNGLPEKERRQRLNLAHIFGRPTPAECWRAFKAAQARTDLPPHLRRGAAS